MQTSRKGISSLQLSKELDITQKSAWFASYRVREICSANSKTLLDGVVEFDETFIIGGKKRNKHKDKKVKGSMGKSTITKTAVFGIKQRNGEVRAKVLQRIAKKEITKFVRSNVEKGATVFTDKASHFKHKPYYDPEIYDWEKVNHSEGEYVRDEVHTNSIESVWAILKRVHKGTFHNISKKHLQKYVDEIAFRLNAGNCEIDMIDRINSAVSCSTGKRLKYSELVK